MSSAEWTWRCAERLHEHWPRIERVDLEAIADELYLDDRWKTLEPAEAALKWLAQGIPSDSLVERTRDQGPARAAAGVQDSSASVKSKLGLLTSIGFEE